ncbi:STAS domain-containing protein [Amycolatopsis sp. CA-128772]|uniref:STAS domain-containing protein n=1 Tax=Amycolatopsis sp. CA-128772 TaxID=2073159 RepID=UPI001E52E3A9|nr:STAS domain-containing protein [Amycolatopsis sp. CA-128772]
MLVLVAAGAFDLLTAEQLTDAVTAALTRRPPVLEIDLAAVTFLDSSGLSVLARAHADGGRDTIVRVIAVEETLAHRAIILTGMPSCCRCSPARRTHSPQTGRDDLLRGPPR